MSYVNKKNILKYKFPLLDTLYTENYSKYAKEDVKSLWDKHALLIKSKIDILPSGPIYLDSILHDSEVLSVKYDDKTLYILLNDIVSQEFFAAMANCNLIKLKKIVVRLSFNFEDVSLFSLSYINRNNIIKQVNKRKYYSRLMYFLHDEVIILRDDFISMGILFWAKADRKKRQLLLEIQSKRLVIEDSQRETFINLFGEKFVGLFDEYWSERLQGTYFDFTKSVDFIEARLGRYLLAQ